MSEAAEKRPRDDEETEATYAVGADASATKHTRTLPPIDDGAGQFSLCAGAPGFNGPHDLGGVAALLSTKVDLAEKPLALWEQQTHALLVRRQTLLFVSSTPPALVGTFFLPQNLCLF
jgi:hypothetical protein